MNRYKSTGVLICSRITMATKYKCCKKDFAICVCVVCFGLFNPSCLDRKNSFVKICGCKIYCSSHCQLKHDEEEDKTEKLNEEILRLSTEIKDGDSLIRRSRRQTQELEDSVLEAEEELNERVSQQERSIESLSGDLKKSEAEISELLKELEGRKFCIAKLERKLDTVEA